MSTFRVPVVRVRDIENIPKADRIQLAVVGDFRTVVKKDSTSPGELVGYLPEGSMVPDWLLRRLDLWNAETGMGVLSGDEGRRVSPKRMRETISEGVVVPLQVRDGDLMLPLPGGEVRVEEGQDLAEILGVTKWKPPIPPELLGKVVDVHGHTLRYDIENRKAWPDVIPEGEQVAYTEKLHGVFMAIGVVPGLNNPDLFSGDTFVASKDLFGTGLVFGNAPDNRENLYVRGLETVHRQVEALRRAAGGEPAYVTSELFGPGIQKRFAYGQAQRGVRSFDVYLGQPRRGRWLGVTEKREFLLDLGFQVVDSLYEGPHSLAEMVRHRDGPSVTGGGAHIREGIVITPMVERRDPGLGRVILKEVSPAYLKGTDGSELS